MEIKTTQERTGRLTRPGEQNVQWVKVEEILKWIEANLVSPFEGTLRDANEREIAMHQKITDYNREKYNELVRKFAK